MIEHDSQTNGSPFSRILQLEVSRCSESCEAETYMHIHDGGAEVGIWGE